MKSILCVLITLTTLVYEGNGASIGVRAKLGGTIVLKFGESIRDIEAALPEHQSKLGNDRKLIVKNGNITAYGKERFGDRITFENGILTVKNVRKDDGTSYFYKVGKNPQVIDVFIVQ